MNWKKKGFFTALLAQALFLVSCTSPGFPSGMDIYKKILWVGSLGFLGNVDSPMAGFMRIMIFILVFAVLYELSRLVPGLTKNIAITVTGILALISAIFIPGPVLAGIGAAYGTVVAFVLIGIPVIGGLYLLHRVPAQTRWNHFIRIVIILLLIAILISVRNHALVLLTKTAITAIP